MRRAVRDHFTSENRHRSIELLGCAATADACNRLATGELVGGNESVRASIVDKMLGDELEELANR
jgi:hypothetical protein